MAKTRFGRTVAAILLCVGICVAGPAASADVKISAMPSASSLTGTELVPIVQGAANKQATTAQVKTFAQSGLATVASSGSAADLTAGTLSAARLPALTGDVTSSAGSAATTISANAVTLGKLATQGNNTVLGNVSGSTAAPSALTAAQVTALVQAPVTSQSGTTYTAVLADANGYIRFTNAGAITFTVPTNASVAYPINTVLEFEQGGAGIVTVAGAGGVTVNSRGAAVATAGQYAVASLRKVATDTWTLTGDIN